MIQNLLTTLSSVRNSLKQTLDEGGSVLEFWESIQIAPYVLCRKDIEKVISEGIGESVCFEDIKELARQDVVYFERHPEENEISVDTMRRAIASLQIAPGEFLRLVVFAGFDSASEQAHNAFLKTLEDGVPGVVFLLQCNSSASLLETVRSRVMIVSTDSSTAEPTVEQIERARNALRNDPDSLAELFDGSVQDRDECVLILRSLLMAATDLGRTELVFIISSAIQDVVRTNTSPKYLLDRALIQILVPGV